MCGQGCGQGCCIPRSFRRGSGHGWSGSSRRELHADGVGLRPARPWPGRAQPDGRRRYRQGGAAAGDGASFAVRRASRGGRSHSRRDRGRRQRPGRHHVRHARAVLPRGQDAPMHRRDPAVGHFSRGGRGRGRGLPGGRQRPRHPPKPRRRGRHGRVRGTGPLAPGGVREAQERPSPVGDLQVGADGRRVLVPRRRAAVDHGPCRPDARPRDPPMVQRRAGGSGNATGRRPASDVPARGGRRRRPPAGTPGAGLAATDPANLPTRPYGQCLPRTGGDVGRVGGLEGRAGAETYPRRRGNHRTAPRTGRGGPRGPPGRTGPTRVDLPPRRGRGQRAQFLRVRAIGR